MDNILKKILLIFLITQLAAAGIYSQDDPYLIKRGDMLSIEVMEHPEFNRQNILVLPDGLIQYPALGNIRAAGLSPVQLSDSIRMALLDTYVVTPIVSVHIHRLENQSVNVIGAVNAQGSVQIFEPSGLVSVLARAGGIRSLRNVTKLTVIKSDGSETVLNVKKMLRSGEFRDSNLPIIEAGDTVIVEERVFNWSKISFFTTLTYSILLILQYVR